MAFDVAAGAYVGDVAATLRAEFFLPLNLPSENALIRLGRWRYRDLRGDVATLVAAALTGRRPVKPYALVHVKMHRYSHQLIDEGNLHSCSKLVLDVLQPHSKRHPDGLGVIADDGACSLMLDVTQSHAALADRGMRVSIYELTLP